MDTSQRSMDRFDKLPWHKQAFLLLLVLPLVIIVVLACMAKDYIKRKFWR